MIKRYHRDIESINLNEKYILDLQLKLYTIQHYKQNSGINNIRKNKNKENNIMTT